MISLASRLGMACVIMAALLLALPAARAQTAGDPVALAPIQASKAKVLRGLGHLLDPSGQLTVRDLTRPAAQSAFKPFARDVFDNDRRAGAHWLKFQISAPADRSFDYYLLFTDADLAEYSLFVESIPGVFNERRFARAQGSNDVDVRRGALGHRVTMPAGTTRSYYLRLAGQTVDGTLTQWQPRAWAAQAREGAGTGWIAAGMAALGGLIALAGLWLGRSWRAALGGIFGLSVAVAVLARAGFLHEAPVVWRQAVLIKDIMPAIAMMAYAVLTMNWLAAAPGRAWARALVHVLAFAVLGAAVAGHFIDGAAAAAVPVLAAALIAAVIVLAALCVADNRGAAFWVMGFSAPLAAGSLAMVAQLAGLSLLAAGIEPLLWSASAAAALISAVGILLAKQAVAEEETAAVTEDTQEAPDEAPAPAPAASAPAPVAAGVLRATRRDAPSPTSLIMELEARIGQLSRKIREREDELAALRASADTAGQWIDPITGVTRRAVILAEGQAMLAQAQRYGRAVTVMLIEVDDYDLIERQLGKTVCDKAMKLLAISCLKNLREADRLARYDDKTFAAILPETDAIGAASLAKRLSQTLAERTLPTPRGMLQLSAVIAYTEFGEQDNAIDDLFARAARVMAEDRPGGAEQAAAE